MSIQRGFVLVGHCGPDNHLLKAAVERAVRGAPVVFVNDEAALEKHLGNGAVLLVNRVLDGDFEIDSGIELIRSLMMRKKPPVALLISNLAEAQDNAVEVGARRGFGKTQLYEAATISTLRDAIGEASGTI